MVKRIRCVGHDALRMRFVGSGTVSGETKKQRNVEERKQERNSSNTENRTSKILIQFPAVVTTLNCTELARNQLRLLSESRRTTMKMITTMNEQLQRRTAATTKLPSAEHTVESQQNVEVDV